MDPVTITFASIEIARDVYDELWNRMEQIDSFDPTEERQRISANLLSAIRALETALGEEVK